MQMRKAVRARVYKFDATGEISAGPDSLAGEEPLEIQLGGEPYTVTMRTPISKHAPTMRNIFCTPILCPNARWRNRFFAQRPLPSMMNAM